MNVLVSAMPEVKITSLGGLKFRADSGSGHSLTMDAAVEAGGQNAGIRPMEALLAALGGCTGMDVVTILRKKRQDVTGYEINVSGERADEHPRVFTKITIEHIVRGKGIDPAAVQRAVDLSATKYCSAIGMLGHVAEIVSTYRVIEGQTKTVG
jgi:putative redox protein